MYNQILKALDKVESVVNVYSGGPRRLKAYDKSDFIGKSRSVMSNKEDSDCIRFKISPSIQEYNSYHRFWHSYEGFLAVSAHTDIGDSVSYLSRTGPVSTRTLPKGKRSDLVYESKSNVKGMIDPVLSVFREDLSSNFPGSLITVEKFVEKPDEGINLLDLRF